MVDVWLKRVHKNDLSIILNQKIGKLYLHNEKRTVTLVTFFL